MPEVAADLAGETFAGALVACRSPARGSAPWRCLASCPYRDLATELGLSEQVVRQHVSRGLKRLRASMDPRVGDGTAYCARRGIGLAGIVPPVAPVYPVALRLPRACRRILGRRITPGRRGIDRRRAVIACERPGRA